MRVCECGKEIVSTGRGRPRKRCLECAPRKRAIGAPGPLKRRTPIVRSCLMCGADSSRRYCSWACTPRIPCVTCGAPSGWSAQASPPGPVRCNPCRRAGPNYRVRNKRAAGIVETWICAKCGITCTRPATRGQRPAYCSGCRDSDWIPKSQRMAIYERDNWTCWLCLEVVNRELIGTTDPWRPSLDHVTPRSQGGSDLPNNLRIAHNWCNCVRSDGKYTPEDFRVVA